MLELKPGDLVVMKIPHLLTDKEVRDVRDLWHAQFPEQPMLVVAAGIELEVRSRWRRLGDWLR